jgi:hypothetical protein
VLHVFLPLAIVEVSILVLVCPLIAQVVLKGAIEDITIEQDQLTVKLLIIAPSATEDSAFAKVVCPSALLLSLVEVAHEFIFIHEFESTLTMGNIIHELSRIGAAVSIDHPPSPVFAVVLEAANVIVFGELIEVISVALPGSVGPLALIELLLAVVDTITMFQVVLPSPVIIGDAVVVEVDALALHDTVVDESVVDLSVGEDVDALSVEDVPLP